MLEQVSAELHLICEEVECLDPVLSSRGGFADVHQGTLSNGRKVAIKMGRSQDNESDIKASNINHVVGLILTFP